MRRPRPRTARLVSHFHRCRFRRTSRRTPLSRTRSTESARDAPDRVRVTRPRYCGWVCVTLAQIRGCAAESVPWRTALARSSDGRASSEPLLARASSIRAPGHTRAGPPGAVARLRTLGWTRPAGAHSRRCHRDRGAGGPGGAGCRRIPARRRHRRGCGRGPASLGPHTTP